MKAEKQVRHRRVDKGDKGGEFVTEQYASQNESTTVVETVKRRKRLALMGLPDKVADTLGRLELADREEEVVAIRRDAINAISAGVRKIMRDNGWDEVYLTTELSFGEALEGMRNGMSGYRTGWNGKDMMVRAQFPDDQSKMTLPYLYIEYPDGRRCPWLASQTDIMATDWGLK